jgi:hypothetical protein
MPQQKHKKKRTALTALQKKQIHEKKKINLKL